jgi:NAD(P)H dehydrogenase (quinone)
VTLGVTGSTGNIGGRVARLLSAAGVEQRLVVRSPDRAPSLPGAQVVQAEYRDRDAAVRALEGLEVVLMVSGSESEDRVEEHKTFVDAAAEAGVRHLVYTSFFGASPDATFLLVRDHYATEQHIAASGVAWTFVRDNLYADFFPLMADDAGVIRGPAGDGRVSAVAQDDIAAAIETVLLHPSAHEGGVYSLTGPESMTLTEVAATMTRALGRDFSYVDETLEEAYASRSSYGAPGWLVDAWISTYTGIASGELEPVTDDVERLTGRAPISLAQLLGR